MVRIEADLLEKFVTNSLRTIGVPAESAAKISESLVLADLRGHHSHGVRRLPQYAIMVENGRIKADTAPTVERASETTATVDGRSAFGQLAGRTAVDTLIQKTAAHGIAAVGVRDASHMGRIGEWAERTTDEDFLFMAFVNGQSDGSVAPPGSSEGRFFTNPLAFGIPTFSQLPFPIILDFATSQVANGKIKEHRTKGDSIPEGWAITSEGTPQTDPNALLEGKGALLPLGGLVSGYKGFGLSLVAELFAATISDGVVVNQTDSPYSNAGAFVAIDPMMFTTEQRIKGRIAAIEEYVHSAPFHDELSPGFGAAGDTALLPGEAEYKAAHVQSSEGVHISDNDYELLIEFANEYDIHLSEIRS